MNNPRGHLLRAYRQRRPASARTSLMLSGQVARRYGHAGRPDDTIVIQAWGTGGQSLGALLAHGVTLMLAGEANDDVGKALGGERLIITLAPGQKQKTKPGPVLLAEKIRTRRLLCCKD